MTTRTWIRRLFARSPRTRRLAPARCRPRLETLEQRLTPSIVYQQTFDNTTGVTVPLSDYSWNANVNPIGSAATSPQAFVSPARGDPTTFGTTGNGFLELDTTSMPLPQTPVIAWTQDQSVLGLQYNGQSTTQLDSTTITTLSWYQGNTDASDKFQIAARDMNGNWFVSQQTFAQNNPVPTDADFNSQGNTITTTYAALTWNSLNFVPGTSLVEGGASAGPTGYLTAIGLFLQDTNGVSSGEEYRFDTFTITTKTGLKVTESGPATVTAGTDATYTVTLHNGGPGNARGVSLTDMVPAGTTYVSAAPVSGQNPDGFSCTQSGGTVTGTPTGGVVASGNTDQFNLLVHVLGSDPNGSDISNTATLTSTSTDSATATFHSTVSNLTVESVSDLASVDPRLSPTQAGAGTLVAGAIQGAEQMSVIRYLQVTFSTAVTLNSSGNYGLKLMEVNGPAFNAGNTTGGRLIQASVYRTVMNPGGTETVTYSFSGPGTENGSLEDGNYSLRFNESAIQAGGLALSSSGDPFSAGPALFHRLFGDSNGDGKVDGTDSTAFMASYRSVMGQANYRAYFDFYNHARIDSTDYYVFLARNGKKLNADGSLSNLP